MLSNCFLDLLPQCDLDDRAKRAPAPPFTGSNLHRTLQNFWGHSPSCWLQAFILDTASCLDTWAERESVGVSGRSLNHGAYVGDAKAITATVDSEYRVYSLSHWQVLTGSFSHVSAACQPLAKLWSTESLAQAEPTASLFGFAAISASDCA